MNDEEQAVRETALTLFQSSLVDSTVVRKRGRVGTPIPIQHPGGELASWFVPVTVEDRIAGFFQITLTHQPLRYASFQRDPGSITNCPSASSWLDSLTILNKAATIALENEILAPPFLTYDRNITRIVWAVKATMPRGPSRMIYIAGDYVYQHHDYAASPVTGC